MSRTREHKCPSCYGLGKIVIGTRKEVVNCVVCDGTGQARKRREKR